MSVFRTNDVSDAWSEILAELKRAFERSREAAQREESLVYVVHHDDLLGRRGPGRAMVATGLLSAARTAAIEGSRKGWSVNVLAVDDDTSEEQIGIWIDRLLQSNGVSGELVRIGHSHLGKALP